MTSESQEQEPEPGESLVESTLPESTAAETNIGRRERLASAALGGLLVVRGLGRRSLGGVVTALAGGALVYRGLTGRSRLYAALETDVGAESETETEAEGERERPALEDETRPTVERSITIGESADDLAERLRDPEQLNRLVGPFAEVVAADEGDERHRWTARAPFDRTLEWEMTLVEGEAQRASENSSGETAREDRLRWESDGALIPHEYAISFEPAPADRGTQVSVELQYDPPGGAVGDAAMDRLGFAPAVFVGTALGRLKSLAETGEIPTTEANPSARGKGDLV